MLVNRIFGLSLAALALTACTAISNDERHYQTEDTMHPIAVDPQTVVMEVTASLDDMDLSAIDRARVRNFASYYKDKGHGPITLTMPSGSLNTKRSVAVAASIRQELHDAGVPWASLPGASYRASGTRDDATILISFTRYVATASPCGVWTKDYTDNARALLTPNFGCATQNNLAALVADPRDLIMPADAAPADAARRADILEKYRSGAITSSEVDEQARGTISDIE